MILLRDNRQDIRSLCRKYQQKVWKWLHRFSPWGKNVPCMVRQTYARTNNHQENTSMSAILIYNIAAVAAFFTKVKNLR
ncbi:unnamed protein product [Nesidiocoris tenuis]|uniref:Uncharacterized protein n=1 Tax=Nesidiocoris tenuis TaxID=355587 RepID=A0A6H5HEM8_9HEMI|nr:unnamed protein product [Nesidiocoris tenuis]